MTPERIREAAARLAQFARPTPLVRSLLLSRELECELWVKNETVSPIASFKWRGALTAIDGSSAVVTSSTGNHGQGVAYAASLRGVPAHVFLPLGANATKRAKIELLGATIHDTGNDLDEAKEEAMAFARADGLRFIDDGDSAGVIEGAGTVGLEICQELAHADVVYVPMGSGSLAAGVAMAMPGTRVVAVQSSGSPAMVESFHARAPIERRASTIADGLICRVPARLALDTIVSYVDDAVAIDDEEILRAGWAMLTEAHLLVEPSAAAALAGALRQDVRGRTIVLVATGSNVTPDALRRMTG